MKRSLLAVSITTCLSLTACGGGSGENLKADPPSAPYVHPAPDTPPPVSQAHHSEAPDNLLTVTRAALAHQAGGRGEGTTVGVMDDQLRPSYEPLDGHVVANQDYTSTPGASESSANQKRGHGTMVSTLILGSASEAFRGGIAPEARLHYARICAEDTCTLHAARAAAVDMAKAGVSIVNLALGSQFSSAAGAARAAAAWRHAMAPIVEAGGLVIAAAGNGGTNGASYPGAAPVLEPRLRDNWLTVGAVDIDANGQPAGLSGYSNPCADTAPHCLVAPGAYTAPPLADSPYRGRVSGTSMATAAVTGVAALVSSVHPWMTGQQLQQTLLTTATDLGPAGVDDTFGWGLVNAEAAIRGPRAFSEDWRADLDGDSTFFNDISGPGSLTKGGKGTLTLAGTNTYAGATVVDAGTLSLTGSITSNVLLGRNAVFASRGGRINGDYTVADATGTTAIELGRPLHISGQAHLGGHLLLLPEAGGYALDRTETVLTAGGLEGTFHSAGSANDLFWTVVPTYDEGTVSATVRRASAQASARAIDAPHSVIDGAAQADTLVTSLDARVRRDDTAELTGLLPAVSSLLAMSDAQAAASLDSLTGQVHGVQRTLGVTNAMNDLRFAADRLPHLAATDAVTTWGQAGYLDGALSRRGYATTDYSSAWLTVGIDLPVGDAGTIFGGALLSGSTRADIPRSASRLEAARLGGIGYVIQRISKGYVSGLMSYARSDVQTMRDVLVGTSSEQVSSRRRDDLFSARLEAGLALQDHLSPFIAAGIVNHSQGAFEETSTSGLGLAAGADTMIVTFGDIGMRFRQQVDAWTFDSLAAYRTVLSGGQTQFTASFSGLQDGRFPIAGKPIAAEAFRLGVGIGYAPSSHLTLHGDASAERGQGDATSLSANLSARWRF